ncbi:GNAT family N-acetyltransferase [Paenibacillus sinopodophylli]|uniref:GNAT family N-acetyltransferase n=1 Tax=Paenibacillus sinopodophylli TaxID=1837342 RepID=UPI00110CBC1F|nr:GNAT family N-acetyltransferase [Paenibacillus sinopodophylli]
MTNKTYLLIERPPTVVEHHTLWEAVGWGTVDSEMATHSISNSIYAVVVVLDEEVVGMGRIVGDGAMYFYIQDVAVLPEHQNKGIGKMIVDQLLAYIKKKKCKTGIAFVGLFASHGNDTFYETYGFKDHSPEMTGMFTVFD